MIYSAVSVGTGIRFVKKFLRKICSLCVLSKSTAPIGTSEPLLNNWLKRQFPFKLNNKNLTIIIVNN